MRKSKRGPPLFELLGNDDDGPGVVTIQPPPKVEKVRPAVTAPGSIAPDTTAQVVSEPETSEPTMPRVLELDGDRIRLSLTSLSAAGVLFALMVAIFGAFEIGRRNGQNEGLANGYETGRSSYEAEAMSEIQEARSRPAATHLVENLLAGGDRPLASSNSPEAASVEPQWIKGYTYVVAQGFSAGYEDDARSAQTFLDDYGIETALVAYSSGATQLITKQGFNRDDSTQHAMADELKTRIHAVGAKYFADGGGYRLEGYFKKLGNDHW